MTIPKMLAREQIKNLKAYSSARDEFKGAANVFLDANESPFNTGLNRYPDPHQHQVKSVLCNMYSVPEDMMLLGNGSDEVIDLIFRVFCTPGQNRCIVLPPTYGMYSVSAAINDVAVDEVYLNDNFEPDIEAISTAVTSQTKLLFICSPNNPTGNDIPLQTIKELCKLPVMLVVDEAYIDFSDAASAITLLSDYENLIVTRTFSKAWGLAAVRMGICFAHPDTISLMKKVKPPYNINGLTQQVVLRALQNEDQMMSWVAAVKAQRSVLPDILRTIPFVDCVYRSDANFILVKFNINAQEVYQYLISNGIVVRDRSMQPGCQNCLRITIGTMEENLKLVEKLREFLTVVE
jgi:histidinol-phosphate aminotransferase